MGIEISTNPIVEAAQNIRLLNNQLSTTLEESQAEIHSLAGVWKGNAAEATIDAYDQFAAKYFDEYHELINAYVVFLEQKVAPLWEQTEAEAERKGEQMKDGLISTRQRHSRSAERKGEQMKDGLI